MSNFVTTKWNFTGAIAFAISTLLLGACTNNIPREATVPEGNVTTKEVTEKTNQLIGQTVTVRSTPNRVLGPSTFTVSDRQFFGTEPILVVNASGKTFTLPTDPNTPIQATGQVRKFLVADINRDYNLGLDPNLYRDYENQPAIIAQSLALAPKPGELTTNPNLYYGKTLAVTGEVQNMGVNAKSFTLDEDKLFGGQNLLVIRTDTPKGTVNEGEKVAVTGVLRPFIVTELERDYDLNWDLTLQKQLEAEYKNKPVLVATEVYPSAIPQ